MSLLRKPLATTQSQGLARFVSTTFLNPLVLSQIISAKFRIFKAIWSTFEFLERLPQLARLVSPTASRPGAQHSWPGCPWPAMLSSATSSQAGLLASACYARQRLQCLPSTPSRSCSPAASQPGWCTGWPSWPNGRSEPQPARIGQDGLPTG